MHSNSIRRSAIVALAALLAPLSLPAEPVTVSTVPFGGMILEIPAGTSIVSDVFIGSALYQGPIASIYGDGSVLGLGNLPAIEHPAYVHVLSGTDEGMVSTILDADNDFVTVETALDVEVGDIVAIRKHQTVGEFFQSGFASGGIVTFYNVDGSIITATFFEGFGWFDGADQPAEEVIMFPGEAFVLNNPSGASFPTIVSGSVNTNPVKVPISENTLAIIGTINPVNSIELADLFGDSLGSGGIATIYENDGNLQVSNTFTYYSDWGFFNQTDDPSDSFPVSPSTRIVLNPQKTGFIKIPAAYSNEQ